MKQILIIPRLDEINASLELCEKYGLGFEYNDFFMPKILDNQALCDDLIERYKNENLPEFCTLHGAFFDVIPFSPDEKIREISDLRIRQSLDVAQKIGAKAVIFHTNYNPFLNAPAYVSSWTEQNSAYWSGILGEFSDVNIYLENMFDTAPDIMETLAENLKSHANFGICLDYAHAALTAVSQREWVEKLGRFVKHIHINDNDLISDLHSAIGEGKIDWSEFYDLYDKFMTGASILIETTPLPNQRKSLEKLSADGFIKQFT